MFLHAKTHKRGGSAALRKARPQTEGQAPSVMPFQWAPVAAFARNRPETEIDQNLALRARLSSAEPGGPVPSEDAARLSASASSTKRRC